MMFKRSLMMLPFLAAMSWSAQAEDRLDHYQGKPADTLEQAIANFAEGNRELRQLLEGKVSDADLARVHELSYTLENALGKMNKEMKVLAMLLEQVHLASETAKAETVQGSGRAYLEIVDTLELGADEQ